MTNIIKFPSTYIPRLPEERVPTLAWTPRIAATVEAVKTSLPVIPDGFVPEDANPIIGTDGCPYCEGRDYQCDVCAERWKDADEPVANTDDVGHPFKCKRTIDHETCCAKQCGVCAQIPDSEDCTCRDYFMCDICCWRDRGTDPSTLYDQQNGCFDEPDEEDSNMDDDGPATIYELHPTPWRIAYDFKFGDAIPLSIVDAKGEVVCCIPGFAPQGRPADPRDWIVANALIKGVTDYS